MALKSPTVMEQKWMDAITEFGCIVCHLFMRLRSEGEVHHFLSGGRRMSHRHSICLCPSHHRGGFDGKVRPGNMLGIVSRDQNQQRFEKRYGTEESLRMKTAELVQWKEMEWLTMPHRPH